MMTLWTGSKELHLTSDDKIGPNEEEWMDNGWAEWFNSSIYFCFCF